VTKNTIVLDTNDHIAILITSIAADASSLRERVQVAALQCILHREKHNDTGFATKLVDAMGQGMRAKALLRYLSDFGAMKWEKDSNQFKPVKNPKNPIDIEVASNQPWHSYTKEIAPTELDLAKAKQRFLTLFGKCEDDLSEQDVTTISAMIADAGGLSELKVLLAA